MLAGLGKVVSLEAQVYLMLVLVVTPETQPMVVAVEALVEDQKPLDITAGTVEMETLTPAPIKVVVEVGLLDMPVLVVMAVLVATAALVLAGGLVVVMVATAVLVLAVAGSDCLDKAQAAVPAHLDHNKAKAAVVVMLRLLVEEVGHMVAVAVALVSKAAVIPAVLLEQ